MRKFASTLMIIFLILSLIMAGRASSGAQIEQTSEISASYESELIEQGQRTQELLSGASEHEPAAFFRDPLEIAAFFNDDHNGIVDIGDYFFATHVLNIMFTQTDRFLGRSIRYDGILWSFYWPYISSYIYNVIRYADACCGPKYGSIGLEIYYDGEITIPAGAWVEVVGVLERTVPEDSVQHLRLRVTSLVELEERGEEFVSPPIFIGGG